MTEQVVIQLGRDALVTTLLVAAPILGVTLVVGLLIGIFQSVTQINEQTLSFVPKILGVFAALAIFGPWMTRTFLDYTAKLIALLPSLAR